MASVVRDRDRTVATEQMSWSDQGEAANALGSGEEVQDMLLRGCFAVGGLRRPTHPVRPDRWLPDRRGCSAGGDSEAI
jgi:hypothetical protein